MADVLAEVLDANARYAAAFGEKGKLPLPPARRFAILTCMDARLDPAKYAGLVEGDAHVIRNAGGRATDDAIRSLVISYKLLGTNEWFVIHHTDCGMQLFDDQVIGGLLENSLEPATIDAQGWHDHWRRAGLAGGSLHQVAQLYGPERKRCRGCKTDPRTSAGARANPDPRLRLRRSQRTIAGRARRQGGWRRDQLILGCRLNARPQT
jgi:carbonic anhydrase